MDAEELGFRAGWIDRLIDGYVVGGVDGWVGYLKVV